MVYDKEKIYDEKIFPLMEQIIDICQNNDMQMIFSCYLKAESDGDLLCNTYLESKERNSKKIRNAARVIQHVDLLEL